MDSRLDLLLDAVADELARAERILFITGAGISADSGLPTYRGVGGLYNDRATAEGIRIEEALSGEMLRNRPALTWKYLAEIARHCHAARPNDAHRALALLESEREEVLVLTQNVDGLHRQAGSRNLIEIHGNLQVHLCTVCSWQGEAGDLSGRPLPPACPVCGGLLRPQVVLFGEALPEEELGRLFAAMEEGFDMVFSIGTSSHFPYIVQPVIEAIQAGVPTVEINPMPTALGRFVDFQLPMGAAEAMRNLMRRLGYAGT